MHDDVLQLRDELVETALEALLDSGYQDVRTYGFEGFDEPEEVNGFMPELQATNRKNIKFIFDVVTKDFFALPETSQRFKAFADFADGHDTQFVVIVPEGEEGFASAFIEDLEISDESIEIWEA
ncbi:hypothetical protein [Halodesulfovibrio spirochaetisodalis]|uniref:Uncharacterized protein n=1 Tax=Halodesulfovibrio spirochaetisodalis TaxID=1560234 RepID=A0A1B7X8T6_9BACT|nr:hypothetical protein [Halodesulfovibrio spirochaetisodalis]OBQ45799.1 hypothetical protein SP90_16020 [Halodesulfovibrio spirochaetisodalis]